MVKFPYNTFIRIYLCIHVFEFSHRPEWGSFLGTKTPSSACASPLCLPQTMVISFFFSFFFPPQTKLLDLYFSLWIVWISQILFCKTKPLLIFFFWSSSNLQWNIRKVSGKRKRNVDVTSQIKKMIPCPHCFYFPKSLPLSSAQTSRLCVPSGALVCYAVPMALS